MISLSGLVCIDWCDEFEECTLEKIVMAEPVSTTPLSAGVNVGACDYKAESAALQRNSLFKQ